MMAECETKWSCAGQGQFVGLGERGKETSDSIKLGKFLEELRGLQTVTSNCVQFRTAVAPKIQISTLWSSVDGKDMNPQAFQTSELHEGDWSSRQFAHIHQVKSALYSLAETRNSQIWIKLRGKERSPYSTQFHLFLWHKFPSYCFRFCIFFSVLK